MQDKWALEEHLSTAENNTLWDSAGESARNGKALTEYVETHLLDVDERIALMDKTGIERAILSLTSPGVESILDTETAIRVARDTNDAVRAPVHGLTTPAIVQVGPPGPLKHGPGTASNSSSPGGQAADDGTIMTESILGVGIMGVSPSGAGPAPLTFPALRVLPNYEIRALSAHSPGLVRRRRSVWCQRRVLRPRTAGGGPRGECAHHRGLAGRRFRDLLSGLGVGGQGRRRSATAGSCANSPVRG